MIKRKLVIFSRERAFFLDRKQSLSFFFSRLLSKSVPIVNSIIASKKKKNFSDDEDTTTIVEPVEWKERGEKKSLECWWPHVRLRLSNLGGKKKIRERNTNLST